MSERNVGIEILEGIREIKAYKAGRGALRTYKLSQPAPPQEIRAKLQLSQAAFASLMGVSLRTVQDWEQGRREPEIPIRAYLAVIQRDPEAVIRALRAA